MNRAWYGRVHHTQPVSMADSILQRTRALAFTASDSTQYVPIALAIMRIGAGLLYMQHGIQKLFGGLGGTQVELLSQFGLAGVLELIGGAMLVLGLFTRPVAIVQALLMVAAYFVGHAHLGGFPIENAGELALLYAFVFVFLSVAGGGAWSLDGRRK